MNALLLGTALTVLLAQAPAAEPEERAVVLPIRVSGNAPEELRRAADALERMLVDALARHAGFKVIGRYEIGEMVGKEMAQQLTGCDAESCMADIAAALDAGMVVATQLQSVDGMYSLDASLLRRADAQVLRRAAVRTRGMQGLLTSVDVLARQLAVGSRVAVDDPRLAERLGTTPEVAQALAERVRRAEGTDAVREWTRMIVERNRETDLHPILAGSLMLGSGMAVGLAAVMAGVALGVSETITDRHGPPPEAVDGIRKVDFPDPVNPDGTYNFPILPTALALLAPVPALVLAGGLLAAAAAVGIHDARNSGRIPVRREGCCRDEGVLEDAARPTWGRRVGWILAAGGAAFGLCTPWLLTIPFFTVFSLLAITLPTGTALPAGPTVPLTRTGHDDASVVGTISHSVGLTLVGFASAAISIGAALLMVATDPYALVDGEEAETL